MQKKKAMLALIAVAVASLAIACGFVALSILKSAQTISVAETQLFYDAGSQETFTADSIFARVSEPVLDLNDDRDLRKAIYAFRRSQEDQSYLVAEKRAIVSLKIHRYLLANRGSQEHQSVAWDLIGILSLEDAAQMLAWGDTEKARQFIGESLEAFRSAVALNSANPDAKRHLELLLTLIENGQVPNPGEGPAIGDPGDDGDKPGEDPSDGAGVNPPGTGY